MNAAVEERAVMPPELQQAEQLRVERKLDEAMSIVATFMDKHFDFVPALVLAANIQIDAERFGSAYVYMQRASQLAPDESVVWNNLALCYQETEQPDEAMKCFLKALNRNPNDTYALANISKLYNDMGEPQKAINCIDKAIRLNPKLVEARYNKGISLLMQGKFKEGWEGYEYNLGKHSGRKERVYGNIPRWTGEKGLTLICYGEQGVGDEINFASCIRDLKKENEVIIECDKRLENLFRRSFGGKVYGTRYFKGGLEWPTHYPIDATVAMGSLPGFFRNDLSDFPGTPYLVPDPLRVTAWRAVLDSLGPKLKVGIAWTGGIPQEFRAPAFYAPQGFRADLEAGCDLYQPSVQGRHGRGKRDRAGLRHQDSSLAPCHADKGHGRPGGAYVTVGPCNQRGSDGGSLRRRFGRSDMGSHSKVGQLALRFDRGHYAVVQVAQAVSATYGMGPYYC